jgi:hypothetical protein
MALDPEVALEIFRLRARVMLMQGMLLKLYVAGPPVISRARAQANRAELLKELERDGKKGDQVYLSDPALSHLSDAERAMYAEEYREIVEQMKSFVKNLTG